MRHAESNVARNEEVAGILDEALAAMGEKERQVVLLRYLQRLSTQETAAALEVSAEAVEKRLERGLEKLRGYFVQKGYAVPAATVTGMLAAESAKAAPAYLATAILSKGSLAAAALAKGTAMAMAWHTAKLVTIAASLVAAVGVTAGVTVSLATAPSRGGEPPAAGVAPTLAPGEKAMMVRWDLAAGPDLAAEIRSLAELQATNSIGYEAYVVDSTALRKVLARWKEEIVMPPERLREPFLNRGGGPSGTPDIAITNGTAVFGFAKLAGQQALVNSGTISGATLDQKRDAIRLKIEDDKHAATIDTEPPQKRDVQLKFTGDVPVGKAAVFVADLGTIGEQRMAHVSVWEAFAASQEQWLYMSGMPAARWLDMTVADMKKPVDRAMAWNAAAKDNVVPPAWEKKLEGGSIVRLYAVGHPGRWPWVWWNANGEAIRIMPNSGGSPPGLSAAENQRDVVVEVEDPFAAPAPPWTAIPQPPANAARRGHTYFIVNVGDPLKLVVGSGPWTIGPTVARGDTVAVEGVTITASEISPALPRTASDPGSTWVHLKYKSYSYGQLEFSAAAVGKDGKVVGPRDEPRVLNTKYVPPPEIFSVGLAKDDTDHFVIRWRKTLPVTFEGYAAEPRISPDQSATPAKIAGTNTTATATKPTVDLNSPEGFFDKLLAAAKGHDATKVRALMEAKGKDAQAMADLLAEQAVTEQLVFDAAVAKFGEEDAKVAFATGMLGERRPMKWKVDGDRATVLPEEGIVIAGPMAALVKVGKEWHLEIEMPPGMTPDQLDALTQQVAAQRKLLAIKRAFAAEIAAGKFKDAYEARDAMQKRTTR